MDQLKTIQIHPMLSFIFSLIALPLGIYYSNTSHVIIYHSRLLPYHLGSINQQPRCKHSSTVLGSYVAAHSTCLWDLLSQIPKRGMRISLSLPLHIIKYAYLSFYLLVLIYLLIIIPLVFYIICYYIFISMLAYCRYIIP